MECLTSPQVMTQWFLILSPTSGSLLSLWVVFKHKALQKHKLFSFIILKNTLISTNGEKKRKGVPTFPPPQA